MLKLVAANNHSNDSTIRGDLRGMTRERARIAYLDLDTPLAFKQYTARAVGLLPFQQSSANIHSWHIWATHDVRPAPVDPFRTQLYYQTTDRRSASPCPSPKPSRTVSTASSKTSPTKYPPNTTSQPLPRTNCAAQQTLSQKPYPYTSSETSAAPRALSTLKTSSSTSYARETPKRKFSMKTGKRSPRAKRTGTTSIWARLILARERMWRVWWRGT
jgi:hypothetical protein